MKKSTKVILKGYAYAWITLTFFLVSIGLNWMFGWYACLDEAAEHHQAAELSAYLVEMGRDTFENWQSEFLQLFSFVVFSAILIHHGSAESRDGTDRIEEAVQRIERRLDEAGIGSEGAPRSSRSGSPQRSG